MIKTDENIVWNVDDVHSNIKESLFNVFKEFYGQNKLNVYFKYQDNPLVIEKYNVLSYVSDEDYFTVYETPSLNKTITKFDMNTVEKIIKK